MTQPIPNAGEIGISRGLLSPFPPVNVPVISRDSVCWASAHSCLSFRASPIYTNIEICIFFSCS